MAKAKPTSVHAIQSELPGLTNVVARVASRATTCDLPPVHSTPGRGPEPNGDRQHAAASRHPNVLSDMGPMWPGSVIHIHMTLMWGLQMSCPTRAYVAPAGYSYPYDINVGPPNVLSDTGPMWPRPVIHIHMTLTWCRPVPRPPCPPEHTLWRLYIRRGQWAPTQTIDWISDQ
jgi:hypothetical protein